MPRVFYPAGAMAFAVRDEVFYVHLSSDGCLNEFPRNNPSDFSVRLKNRKELSNLNRGWTVGLGDAYYSTEIRNMGRFCGTYLLVLRGGRYMKISMPDAFAKTAGEAIKAINSALTQFDARHPSHSEWVDKEEIDEDVNLEDESEADGGDDIFQDVALQTNQLAVKGRDAKKVSGPQVKDTKSVKPLATSLVFKSSQETVVRVHDPVVINLSYVDDFGISYMLRKLLGVLGHESKVWGERFERRKIYRKFILAHSGLAMFFFNRNVCPALDEELYVSGVLRHLWWFSDSSFERRNKILERYGLNIEVFLASFGRLGLGSFEMVFEKLVGDDMKEFEKFCKFRYADKGSNFVYGAGSYGIVSKVAMFEFVLFDVVHGSVREIKGEKLRISENVAFCPYIFDQFFLYLNVVDEESFNDQMVRLLDIIPVKRFSVVGVDNKAMRTESVHFQSTRRKVIVVDSLDVFHVSLRTILGEPVPFVGGSVLISLEFVKIK